MSNDKVVSINPQVAVAGQSDTDGGLGRVDPEFVAMVEVILGKVKSGEITSLYATGYCAGRFPYRTAWFGGDSPLETVGIINLMKHHFIDLIHRQLSE